ncbi:MAG TPA: hypothetical protein VGK32_15235 [Vicinamibacterales bacterium]|jgi:hypothetical protein
MKRMTTVLGYTGAALTIVAAILTPFVLRGAFTNGVASLGLHIDPVFGGGAEVRSIVHDRYRIAVHEVIRPGGLWPRVGPFVQVAWAPVDALPSRVSDEVDVDGDGRADALVSFDVPGDPQAPLSVDIVARTRVVRGFRTGRGAGESFDALAIRLRDRIVVRIPLDGAVALAAAH